MPDFWQRTTPVTVLKKLRKKIELNSFCIRSGENRGSFTLTPRASGGLQVGGVHSGVQYGLQTAFTIEIWFKTVTEADSAINPLFSNDRATSGTPNILVGLYQGKYYFRVRKTGIPISFQSTMRYNKNKWTHVAFRFNGSNLSIFQDGVKDVSIQAMTPALDNDIADFYLPTIGAGTDGGPLTYTGDIAEVKVWSVALSDNQIAQNRFFHRGLNNGLQQYYKLNESSGWTVGGITLRDWIDETRTLVIPGIVMNNIIPHPDDYPPLGYGSSFVAAKYEIALDGNISLKFPVNKPASANFMLCVSWVDGNDTFRRYRLWDIDGVIINPFPDRYRGEKIDSDFTLEVWNVDGEENCELEEDLTIYTSATTNPTQQNDTTNTEYIAEQSADSAIFAPFPLTFPCVFNEQQFGTCENPESQLASAGNYSANLTVYNGAEGVH